MTNILSRFCTNIKLVGETDAIDEAYELILTKHPDIVFLDIEMPKGSGFDLLSKFSEIPFEVIFTTAHNEYALRAIKVCALDYLLKPIGVEDVVEAVQKVITRQHSIRKRLHNFMENRYSNNSMFHKIALPTANEIEFVEINRIIYCEADRNYTKVYLTRNVDYIITKSLKWIEELLTDYPFLRVHNSYVVHVGFVERLVKSDGGYLVMSNKAEIPIARRKREELLRKLNLSL